ncbi:hypothetical protein [uncultured Desulfovibrio sp.]|uniref:hypothetical protein n=1 Tax=uncultured Desulfovibrio sp. TaxID=167968 RepID=UPI00260421A4|nr:hypothetical protein [uncultured Desulfovibrio sp.]
MNTLKLQGVREEALPKMYQRVYQHMTAISEHFSGRKTEMISDHLHEIILWHKRDAARLAYFLWTENKNLVNFEMKQFKAGSFPLR